MGASARIGVAFAFALAGCSAATLHDSGRAPGAARAPVQAGCGQSALSALHHGSWPSSIVFTGHWQLVKNRRDGRYEGSSSRSFHVGDAMTFIFSGRRFCVYGVRGSNGGSAEILIPGRPPQVVEFYAPSKQVHRLIFDSGLLPGRVQSATLSVIAPKDGRPRGYANVEEVAIESS